MCSDRSTASASPWSVNRHGPSGVMTAQKSHAEEIETEETEYRRYPELRVEIAFDRKRGEHRPYDKGRECQYAHARDPHRMNDVERRKAERHEGQHDDRVKPW